MASKELLALARSVLEKSRPEKRDSSTDSRGTSPKLMSQTTTNLGTPKNTVDQRKSPTVSMSHAIGEGTAGHSEDSGTTPGTAAGRSLYSASLRALKYNCPKAVDPERWQLVINDAETFLSAWADQAARLDWTPRDLFGLATLPDRPGSNYQRLSRYDQTGLAWLLQGRRVVALTQDTAVIETANGTVAYRRYNKPALGPLGDSLDDLGAR
jgi:hypothetical protein